MSNDQGEAIFHAARLLQLYEETESIEAVTEAAAALLAKRGAVWGAPVSARGEGTRRPCRCDLG
jgi:hypothetical protein